MDDLIRRSDAIKAYNDNLETSEVGTMLDDEKYLQALQSIPAVEPSEYADIAYGIGVCQGKASVEPCKDAISREYALGVIYPSNIYPSRADIYKALKDAPSVTAETDIDDYMKGYDHGAADTWKIAQAVFQSDVTLHEAVDVVKCKEGADE